MKLQSAKDLKEEILRALVPLGSDLDNDDPDIVRAAALGPSIMGMKTEPAPSASGSPLVPAPRLSIGLGITREGSEYLLAVRVRHRQQLRSRLVTSILQQAKGEGQVQVIGRVTKTSSQPSRPPCWHRSACRPALIGCSAGHFKVAAGTLGAFVRGGSETFLLSNNHILANENRGSRGDPILQPGSCDGGTTSSNILGRLEKWIALSPTGNRVDAAIATLEHMSRFDPTLLRGVDRGADRRLNGMGAPIVQVGDIVHKIGRTTGARKGRVVAIDIDIPVHYDTGQLLFVGQIEIEAAERQAFSRPGDSGSLIVDDGMNAMGLLFASSSKGGANGLGLTYANPLHIVFAGLGVDLAR